MINWKVRFKNPVFWLTVVPATVTFVYAVMSCFDIAPPLPEDIVIRCLVAIITALSTLGVLVDPTTSGIHDSEQAMTYIEPKKDDAE